MTTVRPFRALRYQPSKVDLGAVLAADAMGSSGASRADPRALPVLLDLGARDGDGAGAAARRGRFRLAEWRRAGILARDTRPALYLARRREGDGVARTGVFCALAARSGALGAHASDARHADILEALQVAVHPVVCAVDDTRARRILGDGVDRDADVTWREGEAQLDLWCLDDDTSIARMVAALELAPLRVVDGGERFEAHVRWQEARQPAARALGAPRAASGVALAFIHLEDQPWPRAPAGAVFLLLGAESP